MCYNKGNRAAHLKFWAKTGAIESTPFFIELLF